MRKNLFLTCALALFAIVGVSAQNWCRTLATGLPGKEITHDVNGTSVTQYRAETALIKNAGAKGVRYTVLQTSTANQIKGGGPCFALGEMIVLDAAGDTIGYTVTSNADHNTMGDAGNDGAGMPALNDGNLGNYFHSTWSAAAPNELHYIELTFEKTIDEFQLVWYTRPNQHVNRPQVVGLTNPGVTFTEDMLFAEYEFEAGDKVTTDAEIAAGGTFTLYAEGPVEFGETEGNGSTYIALSGYETGSYPEATVTNLVQFIPASNGKFVLYQPVSATYYGSADKWTDAYNGKNGWQRASDDPTRLGEFEITAVGGGDFEITTYVTRQYADDAWTDLDEPLKVWVGYDMRGNLKIFDEDHKNALEQEDYTQGFGLPVDFGFEIYKASVNKEMVPDKTTAEMCSEILASILEVAVEKKELYAAYTDYDQVGAPEMLDDAIVAAEEAVASGNLANAFAAKADLEYALAEYVAMKAEYYNGIAEELAAKITDEGGAAEPPYVQADNGRYTKESQGVIDAIYANTTLVAELDENQLLTHSYSQIEAIYAQIDALIESFEGTRLSFSDFPEIVSDIPADNFPYSELPNNAVWKKTVNLVSAVNGVRLTFLDRHIGSAGDGGNFPMIAIGELKVYDENGEEVTLTADDFYANHTETNEGFESTVARLCDGNFAAQGYYHSPWSGNEPQEYIYIDITFPESMSSFSFEVYSRDKSTSQGKVSLFPKKVAITKVGEGYDPLLFAENPYNVFVGEKISNVSEITDGGLYVIKGLLNTQAVNAWNEDSTLIIEKEPEGSATFYHGISRFHTNAAAVRAPGVYRFVKNSDGTFKVLNFGLAQYWPSTEETGFVGDKSTYEADKAADINIVASTNVEGAFVMYEKIDGLTTGGDSIDTNEDGVKDAIDEIFQTPYVVFMDWHSGLATRPVTDPQPFVDPTVRDAEGDAKCFNKANGEGEWEIYKVTMDNPDFYYLSNLTGAFDKLGLIVGTDPGCVSNLGALEGVLKNGQKIVADSAYADAPAAAVALAKEIAAVNNLEKNPMRPGVYQIVSANPDFKAKQSVEKALYATVTEDGTPTFGWKTIENDNPAFHFEFAKSDEAEDLVAGEVISEEHKDLIYTIRVVDAHEGETEYYIGEIDTQSTPIELVAETGSNYLVLNANGSAFNFRLAGYGAGFCIHSNGHGGGAGDNGNIVYWDGAAGASQWYLRSVDSETSIDDLVTEGTEVVSVAYYTTAGAAIPAPAKGINIVVTTYANGVVEAKKVLVK